MYWHQVFKCSECGHIGLWLWSCCPKCGSRMWGTIIRRFVWLGVWSKPWTWLDWCWEVKEQ